MSADGQEDSPVDDPDDVFMFRYPVWMLNHPAGAKKVINFPGPAGERAFPLFTDQDLAERFRGSDPRLADYEIQRIQTPEMLDRLLGVLELGKFTHVIFDHPGAGIGIGHGSPLFAIDGLRDRFESGG